MFSRSFNEALEPALDRGELGQRFAALELAELQARLGRALEPLGDALDDGGPGLLGGGHGGLAAHPLLAHAMKLAFGHLERLVRLGEQPFRGREPVRGLLPPYLGLGDAVEQRAPSCRDLGRTRGKLALLALCGKRCARRAPRVDARRPRCGAPSLAARARWP